MTCMNIHMASINRCMYFCVYVRTCTCSYGTMLTHIHAVGMCNTPSCLSSHPRIRTHTHARTNTRTHAPTHPPTHTCIDTYIYSVCAHACMFGCVIQNNTFIYGTIVTHVHACLMCNTTIHARAHTHTHNPKHTHPAGRVSVHARGREEAP